MDSALWKVQQKIAACSKIYEEFSWLIDCYVVDYFTESHWEKLKPSWQAFLENLDDLDLAELLTYSDNTTKQKVWPLAFIALKALLMGTSLSRQLLPTISGNVKEPKFPNNDKILLNLFWKNVKAKKRHEISVMSKLCYNMAEHTNCFYLVDIGSGLGHLSRMLNYGYGLKICTLESQELLSNQARILDSEFEKQAKKKLKGNFNKTVHINLKIEADITSAQFLQIIKPGFNTFGDTTLSFGLVGLHPCGDLGATLLRLYNECPNIKFIVMAGCCYMKLTNLGFPLSKFSKNNAYTLSYNSREIACHAIENYTEKLFSESWKLKIHTYRALLEKIIVLKHAHLRHSPLRSVKYTEDLTFEDYSKKALCDYKTLLIDDEFNEDAIARYLSQWRRVVSFYSLRLLFAPVIESMVTLDRCLYLTETGSHCQILAAFDCKISPRCHILTALKK